MCKGFTLVELAAVFAAMGTLGAWLVWSNQPEARLGAAMDRARESSRQIKDMHQLRAIHQAMVTWAQNNEKDLYPLPSEIDTANATTPEGGVAKDTTGNVMSLLVFNGALPAEVFVSPAERNPAVTVDRDYEFDRPTGAVDPAKALWDPKFSAELGPKGGNISYAHLQPLGKRRARWSDTFNMDEVVLTTRGPEIAAVARNENGTVTPKFAKADSIALRLFGEGKAWSGHAVFNDDHVAFATDKMANGRQMGANEPRYKSDDGKRWPDIWCYDESDDGAGVNNYLGLFVKAGNERGDWKGAWD